MTAMHRVREREVASFGTLHRRRLLGLTAVGAGDILAGGTPAVHARQATPAAGGGAAVVGDVVDFTLTSDGRWPGPFSAVTLRLHPGWYNGEDAWFIRTDASDAAFAEAEGLVHVPLLANALPDAAAQARLYRFAAGAPEQRPVLSTVPGAEDFTPAFRVHDVTFPNDPELLDSEADILAAQEAGTAAVTPLNVIVNYPLVIWPGGGLPVDPDLEQPLGAGPLVEAPTLDPIDQATVTFKLHECYPGSRYIATDTSAAPMAPMMGVAPSAATGRLVELGATAPIYVFGNGLPGPGPMGFQPTVFNSSAGDPAWSPFWLHNTVVWADESAATVLKSEAEVLAAVEHGRLTLYNGTPDTDPDAFVVNCPVPVVASNPYDPATFVAGG
jgi:hypothetical protein